MILSGKGFKAHFLNESRRRLTHLPIYDIVDFLFADSNRSQWTAILELNGNWQDYIETHGVRDHNSGGSIVYISPGIRYSGGSNWNTALSIGTPIIKATNGYQTDPDYRITFRFVVVLDPFGDEEA